MTIEDYDGVKALWMTIKGFAIRSIDDSPEGVRRFLRRNPTTSVVAESDGEIVGNAFWKEIGWTKREDLNYYDFTLNEENIVRFNR